ncbi:MAG: 2-amino-4-hydroxy-6-hydroxymethyldihydropteridine diphosphokinase [Opitutaceae bacterium]|nr:2-amino-4-hydroxy-6-hydroxymethyldihydropteridine diphosphokinase [Opitutaceae bacterium]
MPAPVTAYVALGSNLDDRRAHLEAAFAALDALPDTRVEARSAIYETAPLGPAGQQDYLNAVARLSTALTPHALLDALLAIERARGRVRAERWGPRTLDLDLLVHGDAVVRDDRLTLPHPGLPDRAFVLAPLHDVAPGLVLDGRTVADRLGSLDRSGVRRLAR